MLVASVYFLAFLALLWLWLLLNTAHRASFSSCLTAKSPDSPQPLPSVAAIVPARNEAAMLPKTVPTICHQDYPRLSCIVIDDQSDDGSDRVLQSLQNDHPNLQVIVGQPRPAGWMGKCFAVKQGADSALADSGAELLLFTDADILYHPHAVRKAVSYLLDNDLDALSLFPRCTFGRWVESVGTAGLVSVLMMMFPLGWVNDPKKKGIAMAAGGFFLFRRSAYQAVGGHEAVKEYIIEDVNLARKCKAMDLKIRTLFTPDLVTTRMYEGFADMWEGLTKNAYAGMEYRPERFWVGSIIGLIAAVLPPVYLLGSVLWVWHAPGALSIVALILSIIINLCQILIHYKTIRFLRLPAWNALMMPVSAGLYQLIALSSFWQHTFSGGNVWKGRRYERQMVETPLRKAEARNQEPE